MHQRVKRCVCAWYLSVSILSLLHDTENIDVFALVMCSIQLNPFTLQVDDDVDVVKIGFS